MRKFNPDILARWSAFVLILLILTACRSQPTATFSAGDVLLRETFDDAHGWDNRVQGDVVIGVEAGAYRMRADVNSFVRGFSFQRFEDVVIDVESVQLSAEDRNAYGVVCRGVRDDASANGYYFLISGDGAYSIRKGQFGEVNPLVHWARSNAINQGAAVNNIRVICAEDYLALYVNGEFLADMHDSTYSGGYVGFAVAAREDTTIEIAFDNLTVRAAELR